MSDTLPSDPLPSYTAETLQASGVDDLMRLLSRDEDRVPRNVIDECARRGDPMVDAIEGLLDKDYYWSEDQSEGEWWRLLHAVMILGLMESQRAGELLVRYMRRIDEAGDELLAEWLSGWWPGLVANKPAAVLPELQALSEEPEAGWLIRTDAADAAIAWVQQNDPQSIEPALDRIAAVAFGKTGPGDVRAMFGTLLLRFARARHRRGLDSLANQHLDVFDRDDVIRAYASGRESEVPAGDDEPWAFYTPEAIADRQRRWAEADAELENGGGELFEDENAGIGGSDETYVRPEPKIGRNDPCPCGSGKKYKKCCMA